MSLQLVLAIAPLSRLDGGFLQKPALPTIFVYVTASYLTPAKTHRLFYMQRLRVLLDVQVTVLSCRSTVSAVVQQLASAVSVALCIPLKPSLHMLVIRAYGAASAVCILLVS